VLHLAPYEGKGTRKLIEYLKKSGRITFNRNTVENYARKYKNEKELPDEGIMFLTTGRPRVRPGITSLNDKVRKTRSKPNSKRAAKKEEEKKSCCCNITTFEQIFPIYCRWRDSYNLSP
jgi:hypothetical protein